MGDSSPSQASSEAPLTISTLLNSLHTHLQTQTQLLPTLHAQLGLPQSALTDELSALHQRLAACVEEQIELRREEVEKWMKKCDIIERECIKYAKALGGHTKAISATIGELRKQQVLPVRYEMLNQHHERLDHLYQAKLEQLTNLTTRITALSQTLGFEFFAFEVTEPPPAYGDKSTDAQPLREVTPEQFSKLEKELARGKCEISRRLQHLSTTFLQMDWFYQELDIAPPSCDDTSLFSPSSSSLKLPTSHRLPSTSLSPDDPFMSSVSTPTPRPRGSKLSSTPMLIDAEPAPNFVRIYNHFLARMEEAEAEGKDIDSNPLIGLEGVQPTVELMSWAEENKTRLEEIKNRREAHIQSMYDQLEALWKRLGVEDVDIDGFVENNRGSTEETVRSYEAELERMLELKRERMSVFVGNARVEIEGLWDELMYGENERADFAPFTDDEHSEDLLTTHEEEIRRLKEERRRKAPLLISIRKYFEICDGEKELAASASDQSRLLGRGPRDPGRLLREEKMRKRVSREKPRLEQELLLSIPAWEEDEGRPFLVNGASIMEVLTSMGATVKGNSRSKARAGSVPARSTTPLNAGTKRGAPQSASSDSESGPNKRARIAPPRTVQPRTRAAAAKEAQAARAPPGRAPFGSRSGVLNSSTSSSTQKSGPMTAQKRTRTPSASTLPRPASAAARIHPSPMPSLPRNAFGVGLGLGHASSAQRNRAVSASAAATKTFSLMGAAAQTGRSRITLQPKSARNNRRESFRPRPSTIGTAVNRYGNALSSSVREEDEC